MKRIINSKILYNIEIAQNTGIFKMEMDAPLIAETAAAGQFVEMYIEGDGHILPRPISIHRIDKQRGTITIIYQIVGKGTRYFSTLTTGNTIRVLGSLGNGYGIADSADYILAGGGIGIPPLLQQAVELRDMKPDSNIIAFLGFRSQTFLIDVFKEYCDQVYVSTEDGSEGFKGNILQAMNVKNKTGMIYACGPRMMLKALSEWATERALLCRISMEERMACGIGACVGCVVKIKNQDSWTYKKVCKDGPVFDAEEVIWDE